MVVVEKVANFLMSDAKRMALGFVALPTGLPPVPQCYWQFAPRTPSFYESVTLGSHQLL
jgi:hypothetical protein